MLASILQAIDGVFSALWPQVVCQAPKCFKSSTMQATCAICFARLNRAAEIGVVSNSYHLLSRVNGSQAIQFVAILVLILFIILKETRQLKLTEKGEWIPSRLIFAQILM